MIKCNNTQAIINTKNINYPRLINLARLSSLFGDSKLRTNYHRLVSMQLAREEFTEAFYNACMADTQENILRLINDYWQSIDFNASPPGRESWVDLLSENKHTPSSELIKQLLACKNKDVIRSNINLVDERPLINAIISLS